MTSSENKFFEKIDMLEGETVTWSGGSSKRGGFCLILESLMGLVLLMLVFTVILVFVDSLNPKDHEYNVVASNVAQESIEEKFTPKRLIKKDKYYKRLFINVSTVFIFGVCFLIWLAKKFVNSFRMMVTNERICIQSGIFHKRFASVDIDKVVSIVSTQPFFARFFNLHHLEVIHSGVGSVVRNGNISFHNPYKIMYLDIDQALTSKILLNWLPRDNK